MCDCSLIDFSLFIQKIFKVLYKYLLFSLFVENKNENKICLHVTITFTLASARVTKIFKSFSCFWNVISRRVLYKPLSLTR